MSDKKSEAEKVELLVSFKQTLLCPVCNELHEFNYTYQGLPLLACPKMEPDKIYFTEDSMSDTTKRNQALAELVKEAQEMGAYDVPQPEVLARRIVIDAFIETIGDGDELTKFKQIINAKLEAKHG